MNKSYYSIIEPVIFTASRLEAISNRYLFGPMEMTIASVKILRLLEKRAKLSPKEILEIIGGTKSNVSQRLDLLEKRGYVAKDQEKTATDKRKIFVKITPVGKKKLQELYKHLKKVKLEFESNFSKEEIGQHFIFFEKLNRLIEIKEQEFENCNKCKNIFKNLTI